MTTRAVPARPTAPDRLRELAVQVRHLVPSRRDPERFHIDKNALERELQRLAAELERPAR